LRKNSKTLSILLSYQQALLNCTGVNLQSEFCLILHIFRLVLHLNGTVSFLLKNWHILFGTVKPLHIIIPLSFTKTNEYVLNLLSHFQPLFKHRWSSCILFVRVFVCLLLNSLGGCCFNSQSNFRKIEFHCFSHSIKIMSKNFTITLYK
jgi:hypothetical protein